MDGTAEPDRSRELGRADGVGLIVAGHDESDESAEAVRWAASLAGRMGSALRVLAIPHRMPLPAVAPLEQPAR